MERKSIKSRPGLFGYTNYYDERGRCIGKSRPGAFGSTVYFDEKGRLIGKSRKGFLAKEVYHDVDFKRHITTYDGIIGESHYENGVPIGHTLMTIKEIFRKKGKSSELVAVASGKPCGFVCP